MTPTSALANLGGRRHGLRISGPAAAVEPVLDGDGDGLADVRGNVPRRAVFGEQSTLHRIISMCSPGRRLDLAPAIYEVLVGDPVNVVTGAVVSDAVDFERPWPPLRLSRRYDSRHSDQRSDLGFGWRHAFDQVVFFEPGRVVVRDHLGKEHEFGTQHLPGQVCRPGDVVRDVTGRQRLRCVGGLQWELSDADGVRHFGPCDDEGPQQRRRGLSRLRRIIPRDGATIECRYQGVHVVELRVGGAAQLRLEHDERGLLRRLWCREGDGEVVHTRYEYSAGDELVRVVDAQGHARQFEYAHQLLVRETNRDGGSFCYGYDGVGSRARCVRSWGDDGYLDRVLEYAPAQGQTSVRDSLGHLTRFEYNAAGLVTAITSPEGERQTYRYDAQLRLVEEGWPDGTTVTLRYDDDGNLRQRTERDGAMWSMDYDGQGWLREGTDPMGQRWTFHHDERGRLRLVGDPCGYETRFDHDGGGRVRITEPTGYRIEIEVDADGRIIEVGGAGQGVVRFDYDPRGRLSRAADDDDATRWSYDADNRVLARQSTHRADRWDRSPEGWVIERCLDGRRTRVKRNGFGLVGRVHEGGAVTQYAHDSEGRLRRVARGGTALLELERTAAGRVEGYRAAGHGDCRIVRQPLSSRITGLQMLGDAVKIDWDDAERICRTRHRDGLVNTYAYRPDGLLLEAHNEHIRCAFERDPRGAIERQRWGDVEIDDAHPDHRGRRCGLRVDGRCRVSFRRVPGGNVEDVAVFPEPGASPPGQSAPVGDRSEVAAEPGERFDALWRRVSARGPEDLIWDEGRCLAVGPTLIVSHPDHGHPMFAIVGDEVDEIGDGAGLGPGVDAPETGPSDALYYDAFPHRRAGPMASVPTPAAVLADILGHRHWQPEVRPVPGTAPWNPDQWGPQIDAPRVEDGRLSNSAVLEALGAPFPRPSLQIRPPAVR